MSERPGHNPESTEINQKTDLTKTFDTDNFETLEDNLQTLINAGVKELQVGAKIYTLDQIIEFVRTTKDFTEKYPDALPKELNTFLANINVTGKKISEASEKGLRDCLVACAITYGTARAKNPQ